MQRNFTLSVYFVLSTLSTRELDSKFSEGSPLFSLRLVTLVIIVFGFVIFSVFNGVLTSFLTAKSAPPVIQSWHDILDTGAKFAIMKGEREEAFFRDRPISNVFGKIYTRALQDPMGISPFSEKRQRLEEGYFALVFMDRLALYPCKFATANFPAYSDLTSFALPKGSPLTEVFNYHLQKMDMTGVLHKLHEKYFSHSKMRDKSCKSEEESLPALGYRQTIFCFVVIAAGTSLAVVTFFIELIFPRIHCMS